MQCTDSMQNIWSVCRTIALDRMQNFSDKTFQPKHVFSVTFGEGIIRLKMSLNRARTDHTLNSHILIIGTFSSRYFIFTA